MKRWHEEAPMLKKWWLLELKKHEAHETTWIGKYPNAKWVVLTRADFRYVHGVRLEGTQCHCEQGVGSVRKKKPYGHGRNCWKYCKAEKYFRLGKKSAWRKWSVEQEMKAY